MDRDDMTFEEVKSKIGQLHSAQAKYCGQLEEEQAEMIKAEKEEEEKEKKANKKGEGRNERNDDD